MTAIRKYSEITKITISNNLVYFWDFLSKNMFFVFIVFVYLMLWKSIYSQKGSLVGGFTLNQMIWYLIITELITLSRTNLHFQVNEDVKKGNIAYLLNKPYNYVIYCLSYFIGEVGIKLLTNSIIGIIIGFIYVGFLEGFTFTAIPFIFLSIAAGCFINFFINMILALSAFWFEENSAFFWIYSKLIFTLGGMLMPIELFPHWLQQIARYLPFAYVTYIPAKLTVNFSFLEFIKGFSVQILYLTVFFIIVMLVYRKGARNLNVNGG